MSSSHNMYTIQPEASGKPTAASRSPMFLGEPQNKTLADKLHSDRMAHDAAQKKIRELVSQLALRLVPDSLDYYRNRQNIRQPIMFSRDIVENALAKYFTIVSNGLGDGCQILLEHPTKTDSKSVFSFDPQFFKSLGISAATDLGSEAMTLLGDKFMDVANGLKPALSFNLRDTTFWYNQTSAGAFAGITTFKDTINLRAIKAMPPRKIALILKRLMVVMKFANVSFTFLDAIQGDVLSVLISQIRIVNKRFVWTLNPAITALALFFHPLPLADTTPYWTVDKIPMFSMMRAGQGLAAICNDLELFCSQRLGTTQEIEQAYIEFKSNPSTPTWNPAPPKQYRPR